MDINIYQPLETDSGQQYSRDQVGNMHHPPVFRLPPPDSTPLVLNYSDSRQLQFYCFLKIYRLKNILKVHRSTTEYIETRMNISDVSMGSHNEKFGHQAAGSGMRGTEPPPQLDSQRKVMDSQSQYPRRTTFTKRNERFPQWKFGMNCPSTHTR